MTRKQAQIKLDIDSVTVDAGEVVVFRLRRAGYAVLAMQERRSPSGKGHHIIVDVTPRPRSPYEVVALQAICGSDPNREAMQMHRARAFTKVPKWMRNAWNVLYLPHPCRQRHVNLKEIGQ